jgi:gluconolactonase
VLRIGWPLYVTDPTRAPRNRARPVDGRIWRVNSTTGATELLLSVPWFTNGIAFGPDDRLYVAATHTATIYRYDVTGDGLVNEHAAIQRHEGGPDEIAFDAEGNLVIGTIAMTEPAILGHETVGADPSAPTSKGTIQTWSADGELLSTFAPGPGRCIRTSRYTGNGLVITDSSNGKVLLAEGWPVAGLALHPFR